MILISKIIGELKSECSKGKTLRRVPGIWDALDKFTNCRDLAGQQYRRVVVNLYGVTEFC